MSETIIALDCMGGDNAPEEIVKGAVLASNENKEVRIKLVGRKEAIDAELLKYTYDKGALEVVNATEMIETGEPPVLVENKVGYMYLPRLLHLIMDSGIEGQQMQLHRILHF